MSDELQEQPLVSPGLLLKNAREKLNLSSQNIADKLCLKNSLILAIEEDNYDHDISLTFIKGYLKLYAKHVGVQEAAVMSAFDNLKTQKKEPAKLQSFSKRLAHQAHDDKLMMVTYLIIAIVIALVVIYFFQQSDTSLTGSQSSTNSSLSESVDVVEQPPSIAETTQFDENNALAEPTTEESLDIIPTESEISAQESEDGDTIMEVSTDEAALTNFNVSPSRQTSLEPEVPVAPVELVFTFRSNCWMKLTDSTGEDIAYGTKINGRVMPVAGVPPFSVTICSPDVVDINYDGQTVDLSGLRSGVVANFTLPFTE